MNVYSFIYIGVPCIYILTYLCMYIFIYIYILECRPRFPTVLPLKVGNGSGVRPRFFTKVPRGLPLAGVWSRGSDYPLPRDPQRSHCRSGIDWLYVCVPLIVKSVPQN